MVIVIVRMTVIVSPWQDHSDKHGVTVTLWVMMCHYVTVSQCIMVSWSVTLCVRRCVTRFVTQCVTRCVMLCDTVWQCDGLTRCDNVMMWKCDDVMVRHCEDVTMWQCYGVTLLHRLYHSVTQCVSQWYCVSQFDTVWHVDTATSGYTPWLSLSRWHYQYHHDNHGNSHGEMMCHKVCHSYITVTWLDTVTGCVTVSPLGQFVTVSHRYTVSPRQIHQIQRNRRIHRINLIYCIHRIHVTCDT